MSTRIVLPTTGTPTGGTRSGAISGVAQGAAAGAMVGGPVGAAIGGFIGGVVGAIGGRKNDKAKKYAAQATQTARLRQERRAAVARRDIVREFRMTRAASIVGIGNEEGGTRSSAPQGAMSSTAAQYGFNLSFFDADAYLNKKTEEYADKAGKYAGQAREINATLGAVTSAVGSMGSFFSPAPPSLSTVGPLRSGYSFPAGMTPPFNPHAPQPSWTQMYLSGKLK